MKLRINSSSIRFRVLRSEVKELTESGRIEETIYFASGRDSGLTYALEHESDVKEVQLRYQPSEIVIVLPREQAVSWAESEQVGIYAKVDIGEHGTLDLIVEKDFACLDLSDAENRDTFPNPQIGTAC
jgi:hypothetical protein